MKIPLTIKVDEAFLSEVDRARYATSVHQTRSGFVRNALAAYLAYFNQELLPLLEKQKQELQSVNGFIDYYSRQALQTNDGGFL